MMMMIMMMMMMMKVILMLKRTLRCNIDVRIKQMSRLEDPVMVFQINII
jgi:hypothetical protein